MDTQPNNMQMYGNAVTVIPADSTLYTEVYRAPDNGSGAPNDGASISCTVLRPGPLGGITFIDPLPNDNAKRYYKSRHVDLNDNQSTFTAYSDGQVPTLITSTNLANPMAAFGAIVDALPPSTLYEMRMAGTYPDPDTIEGLQSYIDFPATTNFMRVGQTPLVIDGQSNASPIVITTHANHGYATGDVVIIRGCTPNTAANGKWTITIDPVDAKKFSLTTPTSTGNGATSATGHVVKLSLTIDPAGNVTVYAIIRAVALTVLGLATFLGSVIMQGALRVASLQQPVGNVYNDTTTNRILMEGSGDLKVCGDAQPSGGTGNETVRLGTYTVPLGALTARTTLNQGTGAHYGWNDPDGVADGINTLTLAPSDNQTIAAASRVYNTVGDATAGTNLPAYDNSYTVKFTLSATAIALSGSRDQTVDAYCTMEFSTDGGGSWTAVGGTSGVEAFATFGATQTVTQTFTPVVTCAGAPGTGFRIRLILQGTSWGIGNGGSVSVRVYNATGWATDPWPITWTTTSGATKARRGTWLRATSDGTDKQPHAYLEPTSAITPVGNTGEGEVIYSGDTGSGLNTRGFFVRRGSGWQPLGPVFEQHNLTTTQTTDAAAVGTSMTVKANTINVAGTMVRISVMGRGSAATANFYVKWNGTALTTVSVASGAGAFSQTVHAMVTTAGSSGALSANIVGTAITLLNTTQVALATQNLTTDLTVEWHAWISSGTLTIDSIVVEVLTPPA